MYNITDYPPRDITSYFNGTDVAYQHNGEVKVGSIADMVNNTCLMLGLSDSCTSMIPTRNIVWTGCYPLRLITRRGYIYLAGAAGIRTYKKGLTRDNFIAGVVRVVGSTRDPSVRVDLPARQRDVAELYTLYLKSLKDMYTMTTDDIPEAIEQAMYMQEHFPHQVANINGVMMMRGSDTLTGLQYDTDTGQVKCSRLVIQSLSSDAYTSLLSTLGENNGRT